MTATLAIERCTACAATRTWPRHACVKCHGTAFDTLMAHGGATIHAVTTIHRPPDADAAAGPYAVAILALDAGGRTMARMPPGLGIGDRVIASRTDPRAAPEVGPA